MLEGSATLHVGGEEYELEPGVWARVGPDEKRKIVTGDEPVRVLAVGATPGQVYEPPEFTHEGSSALPLNKEEMDAVKAAKAAKAEA